MTTRRLTGKIPGCRYFWWHETAVSASHPKLVEPLPLEFEANAGWLATSVLDPVRSYLGRSMTILSWYRCKRLNDAVTGSRTSQHRKAEAADFTAVAIGLAFRELMERRVPFPTGQVIWYPSRNFIHIALPSVRYQVPTFCVHEPGVGLEYAVVRDLRALDAAAKRAA